MEKETINKINNSQQTQQNVALCIPSVRRLAKEHNIDLNKIKGTGKNGRILKENVLEYLNKGKIEIKSEQDRVEPIKGFQKAMVKTMTDSLVVINPRKKTIKS